MKQEQKIFCETAEIIRFKRLIAWLGVSRSFIYAQIRCGGFPAPIRLGQRAVAWRIQDVKNWIETRKSKGGQHE